MVVYASREVLDTEPTESMIFCITVSLTESLRRLWYGFAVSCLLYVDSSDRRTEARRTLDEEVVEEMYVTREVKISLYMKYESREDWYDPHTMVRASRTAFERIVSTVNKLCEAYTCRSRGYQLIQAIDEILLSTKAEC